MLNNLDVHINKFPTGRYGFVGTLPRALGNEVPADRAAILGQRWYENDAGDTVMTKFPTFATAREAQKHIRNRGIASCASPTCACYSLK